MTAFADFEDRGKGLGPRRMSGLQKHKKAQNKMLLRACRRGLMSASTLILACWDLCQI